ncbi:unnamed protein product [Rhizophagus irregularis]|uniref:Serine-threonine/tyrosine-protein kinase catalytic domain-containing protein n=1 Tax=Rhizophagus irregularis TaxID=588596 RepID=A0A915Z8A6_9GLOM|nr:unnamed protein product [Rhizophagus irregularis]
MWEMMYSIPAFNNVPHDFRLSLDICQGLRPKIIDCTEVEYMELMKRCWDSDPNKRPIAKELVRYCDKWRNELSFYNYDRVLSSEELSSKIIINNNNKDDDKIVLSESLENCLISSTYSSLKA